MIRPSRRTTAALLALSAAAAMLLPAAPAAAIRYPAGAQRASIVAAFTKLQGTRPTIATVAETTDKAWSRVDWAYPGDALQVTVFHRTPRGWAATVEASHPTNYLVMCPTMPQREIRDLFIRPKLICPKLRPGHRPNATGKAALVRAYKTAPAALLGYYDKSGRLFDPCVAGNNPSWAAAVLDFGDTGAGIWFHRVHGHWVVVTLSGGDTFLRPGKVPFLVALDLSVCVPYAPDIALQGAGAPPAND